MIRKIIKILGIFILANMCTIAAQDYDAIEVSLLTCDPGDDLYMTFGHSALRINDTQNRRDLVYNWGTFDSHVDGFYLKFMRGKLPYMISRSTMEAFLMEYHHYKRGVSEQKLNLNPEQKELLLTFIEENMKPDNKFYAYDFFYDNCATRIRDILPQIAENSFSWDATETDLTFRDCLHQYLPGLPWSEFGIDLVIGSGADKQAGFQGAMFLPDYLRDAFANVQLETDSSTINLSEPNYEVLMFKEELEKRMITPWFTPHIVFLVLLALGLLLIYVVKKPRITQGYFRSVLFAFGLGSLIIIFLWFFTDHQATGSNYNLLWMSPLLLIFPFLKEGLLHLVIRSIILIGVLISMLNTFLSFLPQDMNAYNIGAYALILLGIYVIENNIKKKQSVA